MQRVARDCQRQLSYLLTQTAQKGAWSNVACIISLSNAALHNLSLRQICFCLCLSVCPSVCVFVTRVYCAKTAEQIEMMFGGGADSCGSEEPHFRWGSRSDESIRSRKGPQVSDEAFYQITMALVG